MPFYLSGITVVHTALSVVALVLGVPVLAAMVKGKPSSTWTRLYLITSTATTVTGFLFPFHQFLPSHGVGILSTIALALAIVANKRLTADGGWRTVYVIACAITIYFLFFVAIVQVFVELPALHTLAPTLKEPPFALVQGATLLIFALLTIAAVRSPKRGHDASRAR